MRSSKAVINTSPWISLAVCGQTDLLKSLYKNILIPPAVKKEIIAGGKSRIGVRELENATWIQSVEVKDSEKVFLLHELDRGEAEVIILAQEQSADEVIIDEKVARMHAQVFGIEVVGTLGLLLRARKRGLIHELRPLIDRILEGGIFISRDIVHDILREAGE